MRNRKRERERENSKFKQIPARIRHADSGIDKQIKGIVRERIVWLRERECFALRSVLRIFTIRPQPAKFTGVQENCLKWLARESDEPWTRFVNEKQRGCHRGISWSCVSGKVAPVLLPLLLPFMTNIHCVAPSLLFLFLSLSLSLSLSLFVVLLLYPPGDFPKRKQRFWWWPRAEKYGAFQRTDQSPVFWTIVRVNWVFRKVTNKPYSRRRTRRDVNYAIFQLEARLMEAEMIVNRICRSFHRKRNSERTCLEALRPVKTCTSCSELAKTAQGRLLLYDSVYRWNFVNDKLQFLSSALYGIFNDCMI